MSPTSTRIRSTRAAQPIPGLAGASIKIQNENVLTVLQSATSDAQGQATVTGLPTGTYIFRASAPNHVDASGRLTVRPGVTTVQKVFLDYNLVTVEFSVTETTIQDHYDITLTATYYTQVPAPVVLIEPLSINLPDLQVGEELTGEISITNYGFVRADDVVFTPPQFGSVLQARNLRDGSAAAGGEDAHIAALQGDGAAVATGVVGVGIARRSRGV